MDGMHRINLADLLWSRRTFSFRSLENARSEGATNIGATERSAYFANGRLRSFSIRFRGSPVLWHLHDPNCAARLCRFLRTLGNLMRNSPDGAAEGP
ncbi:hypothetical protein SS05631_b53930 (plasmid) [Sinorhizobium sp. CCBAU 05631]|nr:hypothetical protein SS05631_b53930 [Sinorhizobium sp. CCBAU 05631]